MAKYTHTIAPLLLLWLAQQPAARGQGRGQAPPAQTPTPTTQTTLQTPAPVTPAVPAGRGGRGGGVPRPGPAVGGEGDETPVVTHHSVNGDGRQLAYTATVAHMSPQHASSHTH